MEFRFIYMQILTLPHGFRVISGRRNAPASALNEVKGFVYAPSLKFTTPCLIMPLVFSFCWPVLVYHRESLVALRLYNYAQKPGYSLHLK